MAFGQVSWLVGHLTGRPFPSFNSGLPVFIATHSCGAARDFHPLPYSSAFAVAVADTRKRSLFD